MKIIAIKTKDGYLISDNLENKSYFYPKLADLFFDGKKSEKTFKSDWFKIKNKPNKIEREIVNSPVNKRYELKSEFYNTNLEKVRKHEEVYNNSEYDFIEEFKNVMGLYEYKEDKVSNTFENIEFEWEEILEIETFKEPTGFSYKVAGQWNSQNYPNVTERNLKYDILSEVLTPDILLHTQPCKLSSKETYDIIRKFIKENINPRVSEITSDYDFCFTVKKKIPLSKSYSYQVDTNNFIFNNKKRKPKYETRLVDKKSVQVFEMTHNKAGNNGRGYDKYTLITPFEAENQEALKEYIDKYLEELITIINEPVCECDKCNGVGVLLNKDI